MNNTLKNIPPRGINMKETLTDIPLFILSITDKCNLNCSYCFNQYRDKNSVDLPLEDWKAIYDKYEPVAIQLFGGEPTLRWNDILEFLDYVVPKMKEKEAKDNRQRKVIITTNGTTGIDFKTVPKEYRNNLVIDFSCDGFYEMTDKNRGKGTYKKVVDSMIRCKKSGISTCMICTREPEEYLNDSKLEEFVRYFVEDIGIEAFTFSHIMQPNSCIMDTLVKSDDSIKSIELLHKITDKYKKMGIRCYIDDRRKPCHHVAIHIHANGYVNPKCVTLKPIVGHWTQWSKEDLIKWHNYCDRRSYNCKAVNWEPIEKFATSLLSIKEGNKS